MQSLGLAASRLQQMFDESGLEPSLWARRATNTQDLEASMHGARSASPHLGPRHSAPGEPDGPEINGDNGGASLHGAASSPFQPQLKPRHSPWNWSPRVRLAWDIPCNGVCAAGLVRTYCRRLHSRNKSAFQGSSPSSP